MSLLSVHGLNKAFGPRVLFEDLSFTIEAGEKIGLIGRNGSGKTTLFEILAADQEADDGKLAFRRGAAVGYLPQEPSFAPGATPQSVVGEALSKLRGAIAAFNELASRLAQTSASDMEGMLEEQAQLQAEIERLGGWSWEHQVEAYLDRLRLEPEVMQQPLDELSGGQRRRVALAKILLEQPDLILLDEPTNHLDSETVEWLEEVLVNYPGGMLLVTHDRYFLDRVVSRIFELDARQVFSYPGSYSTFIERKLERLRMLELAQEKRSKLIERELAWMRRGPKARTSKSRSRIKRAEALIDEEQYRDPGAIQLSFEADHRLGGIILEVAGVDKSFGSLQVLSQVNLRLRKLERVGIVGPNGCGKTTLMRVLMGEESLDAGQVRLGKNTKIAYLDQERHGLDESKSVFDNLGPDDHVRIGGQRLHKRTFLRDFLFARGEQDKKVAALSGGERCRLLLAKVMCENANFLILDEPTNDLDIQSMQILEEALLAFKGSALVVTHDRYFMNRVCNVILAYEEGEFVRYDGDYDFYKKRRDERLAEQRRVEAERRAEQARANRAQEKAEKVRKLTYAEQIELESIEEKVELAEQRKAELESKLADPQLYIDRGAEVPALQQALAEASAEVEAIYERWEELEQLNQ